MNQESLGRPRTRFIADLHIHSKHSRATGAQADLEHLHLWARKKGIAVVGTGDFTHPAWRRELHEKLVEAGDGLYSLRPEPVMDPPFFDPLAAEVRFMCQTEISTIYKWSGKTRKVHHVVLAPNLAAVDRLAARLDRIGNINSDGRPILGLDSRDLLELVKEVDADNELIPAHIWTPWFSVLGAMSGFERIEECYRDLSGYIFAVETGLSSDPPMNWRLSALDRYLLVSNSDAHSPQKLGREANLFQCELSYPAMIEAMKTRRGFVGTIEFFPEEGKYHFDGHRKCNVCLAPERTMELDGKCPRCGKPVTVGVMHRTEVLADRAPGFKPGSARGYESLLSLPSVLGELLAVGAGSKRVAAVYDNLISRFGTEFRILRDVPGGELDNASPPLLGEAIRRIRMGRVHVRPGYDGEYGVITVFAPGEQERLLPQKSLFAFASDPPVAPPRNVLRAMVRDVDKPPAAHGEPRQLSLFPAMENPAGRMERLLTGLDPTQRQAVLLEHGPLLVLAGPGTGKTRTLTTRLAYWLAARPGGMALAITFTNRAAAELRERLKRQLDHQVDAVYVGTFHRFCIALLREFGMRSGLAPDFTILDEATRLELLETVVRSGSRRDARELGDCISRLKTGVDQVHEDLDEETVVGCRDYQQRLAEYGAMDFDDLLVRGRQLLAGNEDVLDLMKERYPVLAVDEFQDINQVQYELIRLLAGEGSGLTVIGDPDQSIYGFRGSDPALFNRLKHDFKDVKTIRLACSYRFTRTIMQASRQVLGEDHEPLTTILDHGARLSLAACRTAKQEAEQVVHAIERLVGGTGFFSLDSGRVDEEPGESIGFSDVAVLYRVHRLGDDVEEALRRSGMPFERSGRGSPLATPEVRGVLAWHALQQRPRDQLALRCLLGAPGWGLTERSREALFTTCKESGQAFLEVLREPGLVRLGKGGQVEKIARLADRLERLALLAEPLSPARTAVEMDFTLTDPSTAALVGLRADGYLDWSDAAVLETSLEEFSPVADRIALLTLHAAKGLEFSAVFIIGCEEG
ncbi:UvrD-helicase domain-containing protein, partial [bacterium]|nr:UvrD-helicase domain-containing protein [candidate division CSSED10-310 bacterium]